MFIGRARLAGQDTIDLGIGLRENGRCFQHFHERKGQQPRCRFMPCDKERQNLIANIDVVERLAGFGVGCGQHQVQQVTRIGRIRPAIRDDAVNEAIHRGNIGIELCGRFLGEFLLDRQACDHVQ